MKLRIELGSCPSEHKLFCGDTEISNAWIERVTYEGNVSPQQTVLRIVLVKKEEIEKRKMGSDANLLRSIYNGLRQMIREKRFTGEEKKKYEQGLEYPDKKGEKDGT